jgi:Plavaka transposase
MPCNRHGNYLPPNSSPLSHYSNVNPDDWTPYKMRLDFETTEFLYSHNQMSGGNIDILLNIWMASLAKYGDSAPFASHSDLYRTIDSTPHGNVPWESFSIKYIGSIPQGEVPLWMTTEFDVWFWDPQTIVENLLSNPDFDGEFNYAPLQEHDISDNSNHRFGNFMSGNWAWKQAVCSIGSLVSVTLLL